MDKGLRALCSGCRHICADSSPAIVSASTMVERRCATTMVVRPFIRPSRAFCTKCSLALSSALVAWLQHQLAQPSVLKHEGVSILHTLPSAPPETLLPQGGDVPMPSSWISVDHQSAGVSMGRSPRPAGGCAGCAAALARWRCAASGLPTSECPSPRCACHTCSHPNHSIEGQSFCAYGAPLGHFILDCGSRTFCRQSRYHTGCVNQVSLSNS